MNYKLVLLFLCCLMLVGCVSLYHPKSVEFTQQIHNWSVDLGYKYADQQINSKKSISDIAEKGKQVVDIGLNLTSKNYLTPENKEKFNEILKQIDQNNLNKRYLTILNNVYKALQYYEEDLACKLYISGFCSGLSTGIRNRLEKQIGEK